MRPFLRNERGDADQAIVVGLALLAGGLVLAPALLLHGVLTALASDPPC